MKNDGLRDIYGFSVKNEFIKPHDSTYDDNPEAEIIWESIISDSESHETISPEKLAELARARLGNAKRIEIWKKLCDARRQGRAFSPSNHVETDEEFERGLRLDMQKDIDRTFPTNPFFDERAKSSFLKIMGLYSLNNPFISYVQGMNFLCGTIQMVAKTAHSNCFDENDDIEIYEFLTNLNRIPSDWELNAQERVVCYVFETLMDFVLPADYYDPCLMGSQVDQQIMQALIQRFLPRLYTSLSEKRFLDIVPILAMKWFMQGFIDTLPFETAVRAWDFMFVQGTLVYFKCFLAILMKVENEFVDYEGEDVSHLYRIAMEAGRSFVDGQAFIESLYCEEPICLVTPQVVSELRMEAEERVMETHAREALNDDIRILIKEARFSKKDLELLGQDFLDLSQGGKRPTAIIHRTAFIEALSNVVPEWADGGSDLLSHLFDVLVQTDNKGRKGSSSSPVSSLGGKLADANITTESSNKSTPSEPSISFVALMAGLSVLFNGTVQERSKLFFNAFDLDESRTLDRCEITHMFQVLLSIMFSQHGLDQSADGSDAVMSSIDGLVSSIFAHYDPQKNGYLDFDAFALAMRSHPLLLRYFCGVEISTLPEPQFQPFLSSSVEQRNCSFSLPRSVGNYLSVSTPKFGGRSSDSWVDACGMNFRADRRRSSHSARRLPRPTPTTTTSTSFVKEDFYSADRDSSQLRDLSPRYVSPSPRQRNESPVSSSAPSVLESGPNSGRTSTATVGPASSTTTPVTGYGTIVTSPLDLMVEIEKSLTSAKPRISENAPIVRVPDGLRLIGSSSPSVREPLLPSRKSDSFQIMSVSSASSPRIISSSRRKRKIRIFVAICVLCLCGVGVFCVLKFVEKRF